MNPPPVLCVVALCAGLAACAPQPPAGYRDLEAPIGATTRFDALKFTGTWLLVASFQPHHRAPVKVTIAPEVSHLRVTSNEVPQIAGLYREGMPGELIPISGAKETLVVMWVDEEFRTAAVGTPSGGFGAVLNREEDIPADRARAARDVFEFYGWDVSRLKRTIK